jgi:hypothetical protein
MNVNELIAQKHKITEKKRAKVMEYTKMASDAGYDCPTGRAAYLVSRLENSGFRSLMHRLGTKRYISDELEVMSRVRPATAKRWLEQFQAGINLRKTVVGWVVYEARGEAPWGCNAPVHAGTRTDPYQHNSRREARNCWQRHIRRVRKSGLHA